MTKSTAPVRVIEETPAYWEREDDFEHRWPELLGTLLDET